MTARNILAALSLALLALSCGRGEGKKEEAEPQFVIETINKYTPVKDQGSSSMCWAYAMLATIEGDRLAVGDSVNLSPEYVARKVLEEQAMARYLSQGRDSIRTAGMAMRLVPLISREGIVPYDSYHHDDNNVGALCGRLALVADDAVRRRSGLGRLMDRVGEAIDEDLGPAPRKVWMAGVEYTPQEFAHSVCLDGDYVAYTSFTHAPFFRDVALSLPDNPRRDPMRNVPIQQLMDIMERALRRGFTVCWEGDVTEPGFDFDHGTATLDEGEQDVSQQRRQRDFETFRTTDDHCMALVGIAHDRQGRKYFICKNSWGRGNDYDGLMYMSFDYARLKTIGIVLSKQSPLPASPRGGD